MADPRMRADVGTEDFGITSEAPLITRGMSLKPGAALTMPNTRVQAVTRSGVPNVARRSASMASRVSRAERCASATSTSPPTLPNGPARWPSKQRTVSGNESASACEAHRRRTAGERRGQLQRSGRDQTLLTQAGFYGHDAKRESRVNYARGASCAAARHAGTRAQARMPFIRRTQCGQYPRTSKARRLWAPQPNDGAACAQRSAWSRHSKARRRVKAGWQACPWRQCGPMICGHRRLFQHGPCP